MPPPVAARQPGPSWPARDAGHLLVHGEQMAALETELFDRGMPVEALMEKAGLALSRRLLAQHGARLRSQGAVVLVGPGHNGGDGLVVARELHLAGIAVRVWCPFERCKPLTAAHRRYAAWLGIPIEAEPPDPAGTALWLDALFGLNQNRPPGEALEELLQARERGMPNALVAIDVPTGLCSDSGRCLGAVAARACRTLCLGLVKIGLIQDPALHWVGDLETVPLGLPAAVLEALPAGQPLGLRGDDLASAPWPRLPVAASKYERGRVLLVAGSGRYPGAAQLALQGASATGCGSLRMAAPTVLAGALTARAPHLVLDPPLGCDAAGALLLAGLADLELQRLDAVLVGPGLGRLDPGLGAPGAAAERRAWELLLQFPGLLVLDADGLNRLAEAGVGGPGASPEAWLRARSGPTWLTPHGGEFGRLFPAWAMAPPPQAACSAAVAAGVNLVLKGARSVVAGADGRCWQLCEAEPSAARGGLGDVLAGFAAGLGAMAMASTAEAGAELLASACLAHAITARRVRRAGGPGSCTPMAVATGLAGLEPLASGEATPG
ncbi:Bifunctional NAD(P)H-hydrate repair enzyme Nnr [Includes: ADP-dependent (S)-NAD(P)H-hydrate dehydratase; NAD(P)H-hydrate epimerase] [Cyanobium sp. NIES-981]|nr:Bifunctional NAD(P)H-hydrate repair enzyme Nnr [Includes: ADP-dependent (S)-NAD(P)H-hydrate dehydratase; NAD(P)H-hydrate epimerase] [Cyanobium sp. NIES-981]